MQSTNLDMTPGGVKPRVHVSQYDKGRTLTFHLFDGAMAYTIPTGATVTIDGIKPDMHGFSYETSWNGNAVSVEVSQQMTVLTGDVECEIRVKKDEVDIGSANFQMVVENSPINDETIISDTDLPLIIALATAQMEAAAASAVLSESWAVGGTDTRTGEDTNNSKYWCEQAESHSGGSEEYAKEAEAWARGTKDGTAVTSEDPQYNNHSKYYSEQSSTSATNSEASNKNSEAWAKGTKNGVAVPDTDPQYHNNSKYFSDMSGDYSEDSEAWAKGTRGGHAVSSGDDTYHNNSKYYSEQASDSATLAESWAVGGTNTRTGENTNNSEYWSGRSSGYATAAKAQADRAEAYADFVTPHFIIQNNRLYLKDDAVPEFIVANNRLYIKLAA